MWQHGLPFDRRLRSGTYDVVDVVAEETERPPFWKFVSDAGLSSTITSIYAGGIVRPFKGTQISGWGTYDPFTTKLQAPRSEPPEALERLRREFPDRHSGFLPALPRSRHDFQVYRKHVLRQVEYQSRALAFLLDRTEWDLFFGSFPEPHETGHLAWHLADPETPEHPGYDELSSIMVDVYRAVDDGIGSLVERCPSDTIFALLTPHGMGPHYRVYSAIDRVLEAGGWYSKSAGTASTSSFGGAAAAAKRLVPFRLRWAIGRHRSSARWATPSPFLGVDWDETQAFPLPSDGVSYVRANLEDREPRGRVSRGRAFDQLNSELSERVLELVDPKSGLDAARRVFRTEELIGTDLMGSLPDLVIEWHPLFMDELRSERLGTIAVPADDPRTGDHRPDGFLIAAGPQIEPGIEAADTRFASLLDVAPTVLALLGVDVPDSLPGTDIGLDGDA